MKFIKIILLSSFLFGAFFSLNGCGDKKSKYQHPAVRSGAR